MRAGLVTSCVGTAF